LDITSLKPGSEAAPENFTIDLADDFHEELESS